MNTAPSGKHPAETAHPSILEWQALARQLTGANHTEAVSYGTEAGLFQEAGIPSVICGPGDIREAHKPNEYIEISQVAACETFIRKLITQLR